MLKIFQKIVFIFLLAIVFGSGFVLSMFTYNELTVLFYRPQVIESTLLSDDEYEQEFLQFEEVKLFKEKYSPTIDRIPMSASKVIFYHAEGPTEFSRVQLHLMENLNEGGYLISYFCTKDRDTHYSIENEEILDHLKQYNCFKDDYEPTFGIPGNEVK